MVKARTYVVTKPFEGRPKESDYRIVEQELPALKNGEILVKTEFISVDPYIQFVIENDKLPQTQMSYQEGVVVESKNAEFPVGTHVVAHRGWTDYYISNPNDDIFEIRTLGITEAREKMTKVPNIKGLSYSYAVGVLGMPGASAYIGFLQLTRPKSGDTVVVTGAAGAVGTTVGQIAKIKGCKVIGFAGSDEKVQWLEKELGFDKAFNYKTVDVAQALKTAAPNGVDIYFDNVGGEISSTIMYHMNRNGRVCVCGSISTYNDGFNVSALPKVTVLQPVILSKQLEVKGMAIWTYGADMWAKAFDDLTNWIKSDQFKVKEYVVEGFENAPKAFVNMLVGKNLGKAVVKV